MNRDQAIIKYGNDKVELAELLYETLPDKDFWEDLDNEDRSHYFLKALKQCKER